jgi:hypothetical protein
VITRRALLAASVSGLVVPRFSAAQPTGKMWRIGYLNPGPRLPSMILVPALRDLGYVEGKNVQFEFRFARGSGAE